MTDSEWNSMIESAGQTTWEFVRPGGSAWNGDNWLWIVYRERKDEMHGCRYEEVVNGDEIYQLLLFL